MVVNEVGQCHPLQAVWSARQCKTPVVTIQSAHVCSLYAALRQGTSQVNDETAAPCMEYMDCNKDRLARAGVAV